MATIYCSLPCTALIIKSNKNLTFLSPTQCSYPILPFHRSKLPHISSAAQRLRLPQPPAVSTADAPKVVEEGEIGNRWREMTGQNDWDGLLDPLDPLLRRELIKYGEFSECTHEAFLSDTYSRNYGICKFQTWDFFDHTLMPKVGYDTTKLIYSTSHDTWWPPFIAKPVNPRTWNQTNIFIGFIAVSDDATSQKLGRRDVCVSWRGSSTGIEWGDDFRDYLTPISPYDNTAPVPDPKVKVESGFLNLYTHKDKKYSSARDLVLTEVKRLITQVYPNEDVSITVTGHSLGAALALLSAYDIVQTQMNVRNGKAVPTCAITFAGPRVGNISFKESAAKLGLKVLRVVNVDDKVPTVPGLFLNEGTPEWLLKVLDGIGLPWAYTHVGKLLDFSSNISPELRNPLNGVLAPHNLETYIHLVDGYHGKGKKFESATGRDVALVNKSSDNLKPGKYEVSEMWRVEENKGMVQDKDGKWVHKSTLNYFD